MTLDYLDLDIPIGSKICLYNAIMKSVLGICSNYAMTYRKLVEGVWMMSFQDSSDHS